MSSGDAEIFQRISSSEAKIEMHIDQYSKTLEQLRDMHRAHFERAQNQGEVIARLLTLLESSSKNSSDAKAAIEEHKDDHRKFYVKVLLLIIGGLVSMFFFYVQR